MNKNTNYYQILQVDTKAEPEIIKAAYKRLAAKYHPDVNKASDATKHMQEINLAFEILSDEQKRKIYDGTINTKQFYSEPKSYTMPFYFKTGQKADTPEDLVNLFNENWLESVDYLYKDIHFKSWLIKSYRNDIIKALEKSVLYKNKHIGLDNFIRSIDPLLPKPSLEIHLSGTDQFLDLANLSNLNVFNVLLKNNSESTCVGSITCGESSWIIPSTLDFFVPPYSQTNIQFNAVPLNMLWSNSFQTTLKISNNSQNLPVFEKLLNLKTTKHPKMLAIENYIDEGKWKMASESLTKLFTPEELKYNLRAKITTNKVLLYSSLVLAGLVLNIFLGLLADTFKINPRINFTATLPIAGVLTSLVYLEVYGGVYGKKIDSIILLLSACVIVFSMNYFPIISTLIVLIFILKKNELI